MNKIPWWGWALGIGAGVVAYKMIGGRLPTDASNVPVGITRVPARNSSAGAQREADEFYLRDPQGAAMLIRYYTGLSASEKATFEQMTTEQQGERFFRSMTPDQQRAFIAARMPQR